MRARSSSTTTTRTTRTGRRGAAALAGLALAGSLALTGCGADGESAGSAAADRAAVAPAPGGEARTGAGAAAPPAEGAAKAPGAPAPAAVRPHVIRTASLAIESDEAGKVLASARTAAEGAGGFVGNESTRRGKDGRMASSMTLRVPSERFDAVLGALEGSGKLLSRKVEAQDVTEKVADVDSRVRSQQASVARVREMMERATALGDVVMLEGELGKRQSDLESLLAQQTALKDRTSLGTITVEVSEPQAAAEPAEDDDRPSVWGALRTGWEAFTNVVAYAVVAVALVLPFAVAAAVGVLGFRFLRRRRRGGGAAAAAVPAAAEAPAAPAGPAVPAAREGGDPTESPRLAD
ncbi:DUF4349 domain-containing protein [Streptomyces sp. WAC05292]|uniref:DUF4349 domain-containing protein n=1 Tax=Streptomyces sp. WAC05292 TaxID=2487418 RepID=UPI0021AE8326|nr:DUF4349 domain-containing protein [Streptomyces sp. WAC05292]